MICHLLFYRLHLLYNLSLGNRKILFVFPFILSLFFKSRDANYILFKLCGGGASKRIKVCDSHQLFVDVLTEGNDNRETHFTSIVETVSPVIHCPSL